MANRERILELWQIIVDIGLTKSMKPLSKSKLEELSQSDFPGDYIYFLKEFGSGPVQKADWPTYIVEFPDGPVNPAAIYSLNDEDKRNIEKYGIFSFDVDGGCKAFALDGKGDVYSISVDGLYIRKLHSSFGEYLEWLVPFLIKQVADFEDYKARMS